MLNSYAARRWSLAENTVFRRTNDEFGAFSNFATEYPLCLKGFIILSSEHLYQAMRFPHSPEIQAEVLFADSPKGSKEVARQYDESTRADWMDVRVAVMRWVLGIKLFHHSKTIGKLLERSHGVSIVEYSKRDDFWGAKPTEDEEFLMGQNVLGCLLTELRDQWRTETGRQHIAPTPEFPRAVLLGDSLND